MRKGLAAAAILAGLACIPSAAGASGDGGCWPGWTLEAQDLSCAGRVVIGPGNNTMINLVLLHERVDVSGADMPDDPVPWRSEDYGETFFSWRMLVDGLYPGSLPQRNWDEDDFTGTRCQSVRQGGEDFLAAVARNRAIAASDRERLAEGRAALLRQCERSSGWRPRNMPEEFEAVAMPRRYASLEAREFGTYLAGASAFYSGDWRGAKARFVALRNTRDPWLREAARYMEARNALNEAATAGLNDWGYFDREEADDTLARSSEQAFNAYLSAYPDGRYAASARGLVRRSQWLRGSPATTQLGEEYSRQLAETDPTDPRYALLVQEIDNAFLLAGNAVDSLQDPVLLATIDLLRMRIDPASWDEDAPWNRDKLGPLRGDELARQEAVFADRPDLFGFLQANQAFYIDHDYRRVLELLPDDARRDSYSNLQFSRQALRGMALARLEDRNEPGFWQELLGGAASGYQRTTAELGLALAWERAGRVDLALAADSPVTNPRTRAILIENSAGPEVLRSVASGAGRTRAERELAAFVLVYRELRRGDYAAARRDLALTSRDGPAAFYDRETYRQHVPVAVYNRGRTTGGYQCPALGETVDRLARNARDVQGRLCLGDFFRLNGFDNAYLDWPRFERGLGSHASYPGEAIPRSRYYDEIIAERGVSREDRAYALYRAIHCYAPGGNSSCGDDYVELEQRRAWFRRLKNEFGDTRWGREAEYYW